jgi:TPR repeat protein
MLSKGQGCEPDPTKAASWMQEAAALGLEQARAAIGTRTLEA